MTIIKNTSFRASPKILLSAAALSLSVFAVGGELRAAALEQSGISLKSGVWPVMVRMDYNPILQIKADVGTSSKPVRFDALKIDFTKTTNIADIAEAEVYVGGSDSAPGKLFGSARPTKANPIVTVRSKKPFELEQGKVNEIWVSVRLKDKADIRGRVAAVASQLVVDGKPLVVNSVPANQRIGYAVAKSGDLGSKNYRIPAMVRNPKTGTLVATFDIRYNHAGDLPANIDVGVARSEDGGRTWSPVESVLPSKNLEVKKGVGDPGILVNDKTGEIWIAALWAPQSGHPIWASVADSVSPQNCGQVLLIKSKDDGKNWSKPINITPGIKRLGDKDTENWGVIFQGPGAGICTKDGTLVFPGQVWMRDAANAKTQGEGASQGVLIYSKDGGKTWTSTKSSPFGGSESTCLEKKNGSIALNTRTNKGWGRTGSILAKIDSDRDWVVDENLTRGAKGVLRQPGGCQGALLSVGNDWFFSNPNSGKRDNMTIKHSRDEGKSWSDGLLYDERACAGYSSLALADDKNVGILYEGVPNSQTIFFLSIPVAEIKKAK